MATVVNYFAHAYHHLDRPHFLAGLAIPDWLSAGDRGTRVRSRTILERRGSLPGRQQEIADGILRHLDDDRWFHSSAAFVTTTSDIGRAFARVLPPAEDRPASTDPMTSASDRWHCGFLGHLVLELLIDGELSRNNELLLQRYYEQMAKVDMAEVAQTVASVANRPSSVVGSFMAMFLQERFLEDYADDDRLLRRINQVLRRVSLTPLPEEALTAIAHSRGLVRTRLPHLLPADRWG